MSTKWTATEQWKKVVAWLHWDGEFNKLLTTEQQAQIRLQADGFGNLREPDKLVMASWDPLADKFERVVGASPEAVQSMLWDWSHVRDSSPEAVEAMCAEIDKVTAGMETLIKHAEGLVAFPTTFGQLRAMGKNV